MKCNKQHHVVGPRGAVMVEFALVFLIFMVLVLGILDFGRYYAAQALLTKGAQEGVNLASKIPFIENDIRAVIDNDPRTADEKKKDLDDFVQARRLVVNQALNLPVGSGFLSIGGGPTSLVRLDAPNDDGESLGAMLIRPGERSFDSHSSHYIEHPTLCNTDKDACKGKGGVISSSDIYADLFAVHPIVVEMRANVFFFSPWIGSLPIRARAVGYREQFPRGSTPKPVVVPAPPVVPPGIANPTDPTDPTDPDLGTNPKPKKPKKTTNPHSGKPGEPGKPGHGKPKPPLPDNGE